MPQRILIGANMHAEYAAAIERARPELAIRSMTAGDVATSDLAWADTYVGFKRPALPSMGSVRWVHSTGAGVDGWLMPDAHSAGPLPEDILLTRSSESFGPRIAEWVLSRVLTLAQAVIPLYEAQRRHEWKQREPMEIRGSRALVIGTGDVGRHTAALLKAVGCNVTGVSRSGEGDASIFSRVVPVRALVEQVGDADWIVMTVPRTADTQSMFNRAIMARCNGATLLNVGRGATVEEGAIPEALDAGWLRGVALDVFETEPLPESSPLWGNPRVLVSPHVSGLTTTAGVLEGFVECLEAIERGETPRWAVDRGRGY